ncbi:MAG: alkaline phosphatase [Rhodothermales bacterium]
MFFRSAPALRCLSALSALGLSVILLAGCAKPAETAPRNVILLIGDGMGLAQISTLYYNDTVKRSAFERFERFGYIKTQPAVQKVTDSAAGATAFASGVKTYNGAIGVDADSNSVETIVERVSKEGLLTGLVATSSIVHATPACFFAHVPARSSYEDIAAQLPESGVDFFAGGGTQFFARRSDGRNVFQALSDAGFVMDSTALATAAPLDNGKKYGFLLAPDGMPPMSEGRGSFLLDATNMAIDYLRGGKEGFFLMVEGSQIDWGGHGNNYAYLASEMADFNTAIGAALDFAAQDGHTLVIVTADHETGGLALSTGASYNEMKATFSTGGHTGTLIPVFAYGPGSDAFSGIYENSDIFHKIIAATGW